jgi:PAS domain S-box-containing protein
MSYTDYVLSDKQLLEVLSFSTDATAIHVSEDAIIQYANEAMLAIWGKGKTVIGKSLEDALPELKGQPFIDLFKKVWNEGLTIKGSETAAELMVDGKLQTFYFDFEYRAIKNDKDEVYCILHMAKDITELVLGKKREQDLIEELRALNEELLSANEEIRAANEEISAANEEMTAANEEITAANEEIRAANEEITASNEELSESQKQLMQLYQDLTESDSNFRNMVKQAPVGICIIRAKDLFIEDVNLAYLELVGKQRNEMEGRTIWEAIPEAAEAYAPVMNNVIATGTAFVAKEHELILIRNGVAETVFVDFVYEPIRNNGEVQAIMVLAIEVSDKVIARRSIEDVEERIRLAVEAAEIGTFDLDLINRVMLTSERFDTIFGFDKHVSWEKYTEAIHPDDKHEREAAHKKALVTGKLFYESRVIYPDASIHWVRIQGNVYYNKDGKPQRVLGTLLDITQFKRLEQQKDDFISIASHELKTPITSLKASLQLLEKFKESPESPVVPKLIDQSLKSMQKISTLVEDLLNVSRTQQSQLKLNKTTFTISHLLDSCCNHVRVAGKYTLTIQGDKKLQVYADEHAIDQVMVNFVNNAVKYASESLEIFMMIEKTSHWARISVRDTGPGIDPRKIPYLFDRYYQAQSGGFNNSGLGLGLYICSEIIRKHGGQIGVDSVLGQGSTFWFTLPLDN